MLLSQRIGPFFSGRRSIVSKRSSEVIMSEQEKPVAKETFEELDELMVLYTRSVPLLSGAEMVWYDVQIYLSKGFLAFANERDIKVYLDRAVAAILTRNGIS